MSNRLGGKQGTAYLGTNANQPPNMHFMDRPPTEFDKFDYSVGDFWIDGSAPYNYSLWVLVSLEGNPGSRGELAHWIPIHLGVRMINQINVDGNNPVYPLNGVMNIYGVHGITTAVPLAPNTVNIGIANTIKLGDLVPLAPATAALEVTTGDVLIDAGSLDLPNTTIGSTAGCINMGGIPWLRNYGTNNIFLGPSGNTTLTVVNAIGNLAFGCNSLASLTTGAGNIVAGVLSLNANTTGNFNIAISNNVMLANTSGSYNIGIGVNSLHSNVVSHNNVALGAHSLGLTTAANSVALGVDALSAVVTGANNIGLGYSAGINYVGAETNNIVIGAPGTAAETNTIRLGATATAGAFTAQTACWIGGIRGVTTGVADAVPVLIDSTGQLGTISSSLAYKENIADLGAISKSIYNLRPVSFNYKSDKTKRENYGLIAEEVDEQMPSLVVYNSQHAPETVRYLDLIPLMLNEMIKINGRVLALEERYGS
jgi:Chaperone of endosialidase